MWLGGSSGDRQRPALEERLGARWGQESSLSEAQDKVSLLGFGSFAKANKTLVLTLLICFSFFFFPFSPGNVFLHQEVQEASQNSIGNETLSSNFISSFWKVSRCGFQSAGTPRLSYRFGTRVLVTNVILQCAVMVAYCSMKQRVLFQWHQAAFWGLNTFVRDSEVSGWWSLQRS